MNREKLRLVLWVPNHAVDPEDKLIHNIIEVPWRLNADGSLPREIQKMILQMLDHQAQHGTDMAVLCRWNEGKLHPLKS